MHHLVKWAALPLALFCTWSAHAGGFCDDDDNFDDWNGGAGCQLLRASLPPELPEDGFAGSAEFALPNWSEIDLRPYFAPGVGTGSIEFTLSLAELGLAMPELGEASEATRVDVLELALTSPGLYDSGANGYRLLRMSIVRDVGSTSYGVDFSWREEHDPNMAIGIGLGLAAGELNAAVGQLSTTEDGVHVVIKPVDRDWARVSVDVKSLGPYRPIPLVFDNRDGFAMPHMGEGGYTQPLSLRVGIIAGNLDRTGMTTFFSFIKPMFNPGS